MKKYTEEINGFKFNISAEEMLYPQVNSLFYALKTVPIEKLSSGFKLQIGFSVFVLIETGGEYNITVPDYENNPFAQTTEDLTVALWVQFEQTDLLRSYKLEGEPVRFDDKIVIAKDALEKKQLCLQRFSDLGESGWCVNAIEQNENGEFVKTDAEEYESIHIYTLLKLRPELIKALVLPYNYIVVFDGDEIVEILNEQNESIL